MNANEPSYQTVHRSRSSSNSPPSPTSGFLRKTRQMDGPRGLEHHDSMARASVGKRKTKRMGLGSTVNEETKNEDYCDACGGAGRFLCCDACPKAFHFTCVEPPMEAEDVAKLRGKWFCQECKSKHHQHMPENSTRSDVRGLFHSLLQDLMERNPKAFRLPYNIRTFFEGVSTNRYGEYVDESVIKPVKYNKYGHREEPDYRCLKDKQGHFILCHRCLKTALMKPIIGCDYCSFYWHLDCLSPPMTNPPNVAKKWMCPNHADHGMPRKRKRRDLILTNNDSSNSLGTEEPAEFKSDQDDTDIPGYTQTDGIVKYARLVYRLSPEPIKLNFMDYARRCRRPVPFASVSTTRHTPTPIINIHDSTRSLPTPYTASMSNAMSSEFMGDIDNDPATQEWLDTISGFQSGIQHRDENRRCSDTPEGIHMLIQAALVEDCFSPTTPSGEAVEIDLQTYQRYKALEDLIRRNGRDKFIKLLLEC